jgi:hypothetical protein
MNRAWARAAAVAIAVAAAPASHGHTGNELKEFAEAAADSTDYAYFAGYVTGVINSSDFEMCLPPGATRRQAWEIVLKTLRGYPEILHQDAATIVVASISVAWPCNTDGD